MSPFLRFIFQRILSVPITLFIVTSVLYAFMMLTPPEERASLYLPRRIDRMTTERIKLLTEGIIRNHHLREPFPLQYGFWIASLIKGEWGYSPIMQNDVIEIVKTRSPVTLELTFYTLLFFIPTGLLAGLNASRRKNSPGDHLFRFSAFSVSSIPPFILGIILLGLFYVTLHWFPPERLSTEYSSIFKSDTFRTFTGFATIDGLLNCRFDVTLDAFRHLVLPVTSLGLVHWATLGRVARVSALEELPKYYITAARSHGVNQKNILWKHIFRNILAPSLTSSALSAASLYTGVIVIERTFNFKGVSEMMMSMIQVPDTSAVLGFAVYSILVVLAVMFILDIMQAIFDPRVRAGLNLE